MPILILVTTELTESIFSVWQDWSDARQDTFRRLLKRVRDVLREELLRGDVQPGPIHVHLGSAHMRCLITVLDGEITLLVSAIAFDNDDDFDPDGAAVAEASDGRAPVEGHLLVKRDGEIVVIPLCAVPGFDRDRTNAAPDRNVVGRSAASNSSDNSERNPLGRSSISQRSSTTGCRADMETLSSGPADERDFALLIQIHPLNLEVTDFESDRKIPDNSLNDYGIKGSRSTDENISRFINSFILSFVYVHFRSQIETARLSVDTKNQLPFRSSARPLVSSGIDPPRRCGRAIIFDAIALSRVDTALPAMPRQTVTTPWEIAVARSMSTRPVTLF